MTLPSLPALLIPVDFEQSKYSRKGLRIYRAKLYGGSVWAFMWEGNAYVCYSLHTAYNMIDKLRAGEKE